MRTALLCAGVGLAGACAQASIGNAPTDSGNHGGRDVNNNGIDSSEPIDARPIDAARSIDAPITKILSETVNSTMVYGNSIACSDADNGGDTLDNIWYRAFQLSDFSITDGFDINTVTFSVQESTGSPTVTVMIGSYTGTVGPTQTTVNLAMITPLATATVVVPPSTDMNGENVPVPIAATIPADGKFVVEVSAPNQDQNSSGYMYIGGTTAGETDPSFLTSVGCSIATPETSGAAGGTGQIIINVTGTY